MVAFARERLAFWPDSPVGGAAAAGVSRGMVNCTRQRGKSTVAAVMAGEAAMSVDGYLGPKRGELRLNPGDVLGRAR